MDSLPWTLVRTADGSDTIHDETVNQHYHSTFGAIGESRHIFIEQGFLKALEQFTAHESRAPACPKPTGNTALQILEIGFGTGLNAWLTLIEAEKRSTRVHYHSIESRPLPEEILRRLNYPEKAGEELFSLKYNTIHECPWDQPVVISDHFILHKIKSRYEEFTPDGASFHLIYFDAFDPEAQPEMWTASLFTKLFHALHPGGVLVTYSSKGLVKRALRDSGFRVERLPGPPGKRHMLRATRIR
ncbi:MAG: tRNA (5-methylaminomethyl-2-thiouridine)(34)-methyltransferase MnmD [Bacteroidales bacterium]|nr:tRNA (5-methylaminomethyl-2-thiouridine)(34)-methyltransferase MnmD [Bacteroidales bacterium]HNW74264.1 tRNA (5-methylaminomethyl-2-thiouridine)(34)-methyltransferase MnmD [Bacteroidales bacterium]HPS51631.1 tRNA (5-methylaminomethyl-2-thiouridine)(34)-methyltransferase MnmD [Bacteroidales bacterium]